MGKTISEIIVARLNMPEDDLFLEIARQEQPTGTLHSPESFRRKAQEILGGLLPDIRQAICKNRKLHELQELALAMEIVAVISQRVSIAVACTVAAYLAKRGLNSLCSEDKENE